MATKKEKLLEDAQRLAMRGQIDKAASAYRELIALEPNAINHRQHLAELLVKGQKLEDARVEFEWIGKHYSNNGFYLKAIAVYKQVQKFFPSDISLTITLADLNQKHGLTANALAEYKSVFDYYEKNGQPKEALKILETMQAVDPKNVNVRLKLAEIYFTLGRGDDSYGIFCKAASILQERGDSAGFARLNSRIQQLFPQKKDFMLEVLEEQIKNGQAINAITGLQSMLRLNPNVQKVWDLVISAYTSLKQPQKLKLAYQHYLKFFPESSSAQTGLILSLASENNLKGALDLLTKYETSLLSSGAAEQVINCYKKLEELDPINLVVMEGLKRALIAAGKVYEAELLEPKISSLKSLATEVSKTSFHDSEPLALATEDGPAFLEIHEPEPEVQFSNTTPNPPSFFEPVSPVLPIEPTPAAEEEIEIEIDLDDDFCGASLPDSSKISDDWLSSVGEMFDGIATTPRAVRFDNSPETVDSQSHYDLGIAFKEMGLFDEAIQEFHQAILDPAMKLRSLVLQGACLREKGEFEKSESVLRALIKPELSLYDSCSVKYELAMTAAAAGKQEESAALLQDIERDNPGFRDVKSLLDATQLDESSLDFSDEELQGFDLK